VVPAAELEQARQAWNEALGVIDAERTRQMAAPGLQEPAKNALAALDREWDGLAAHRDYPIISLDNNAAERALRRPVVTRKNADGSRNEDAARLAARIWTITATAEMARLNPITYLTAYLDACGRTSGKPPAGPNLERFLPWTATAKTWTPGHDHPALVDTPGPRHGVTAEKRSRRSSACQHGTSEYLHDEQQCV
jgi:hypothetical protein